MWGNAPLKLQKLTEKGKKQTRHTQQEHLLKYLWALPLCSTGKQQESKQKWVACALWEESDTCSLAMKIALGLTTTAARLEA